MFKIAVFHKSLTMLFIVTMIVTLGGYTLPAAAQHVTDGLEAYWPFDADTCDEGAEGDCADLAGGHDAMFNFPIKLVPGVVGEAVEFDGENVSSGCFVDDFNLIRNSYFHPSATTSGGDTGVGR